MVLLYTVCDIELPNPRNFTYPGKFIYSGVLQEFLHDLILGLPYPGKLPYLVKTSILKSVYLFKINYN